MVTETPEVPWEQVVPVVADLLGSAVEDGPVDLGGSDRSHVWRIASGGASYVVKVARTTEGDTFAREAASLEAFAGAGAAPRLVGVSTAPQVVVMEDLGTGHHLADALLGDDREIASRTLRSWARAVGELHVAATPGVLDRFARRLDELAPGAAPRADASMRERSAELWREHASDLGVDVEPGLAALESFVARLSEAPSVLTPGDACPDNNVVPSGESVMRLLDFEGAEVRHPAWDLAYLTTPWPSCWCAWALPDEEATGALEVYRATVGSAYVAGPAFDADLRIATLAWSVMTPAWFLGRALDGEAEPDERIPHRRQMVQHRLRQVAAAYDAPDALVGLAGSVLAVLEERWGVVGLPLGPAWRFAG